MPIFRFAQINAIYANFKSAIDFDVEDAIFKIYKLEKCHST